MRERLRLKPERVRLKPAPKPRSQDYLRLRYWWLSELRTLRAKRKYGSASKRDIKLAQKELVRIRREH